MLSQSVAQLREAMEAVASGRRVQTAMFFNYKILSRFVAANDTALNTLRPIRPCFTANSTFPLCQYCTQFSNGLPAMLYTRS